MDNIFRKVDQCKYTAKDMPIYPNLTLISHVGLKGVQAGSLIGIFLVSPTLIFYKRVSSIRAALPISTLLGGAVSYMSGALNEDGVDDRAYRISMNTFQTTIDNYSIIGGLSGTAIGTLSVFPTASVGIACGVLTAIGLKKLKEQQATYRDN